MHQTQFVVTEIKRFLKRRKIILILAPLLFTGLSVAAILYLPPKYESDISILVERDETLNPMIQFTMAVALASEDRLRSFNEIVYSRSTINMLIDSLGLDKERSNGGSREDLIRSVRRDISTNLRASDSFSISYLHNDPALAQKGVQLLADHFIQKRLSLENRRHEQTVDFFENKVEELQQSVREREQRVVAHLQQTLEQDDIPREEQALQSDIDDIEDEIERLERRMERMEASLELLQEVNSGERHIEEIRELNLEELPSGMDMRERINRYRDYMQRYTAQFPGVRELVNQIHDLSERMITEIHAVLFDQNQERIYLLDKRSDLMERLEQTAFVQHQRAGSRGDLEVYKALLDDMKVKVEQARSSRDLGERAQQQFIVIDSPNLPEKPAKPDPLLVLGGGIFLGIFLGVVGAGFAELLDTTVRRPEDLAGFDVPVIAYLPSGKN